MVVENFAFLSKNKTLERKSHLQFTHIKQVKTTRYEEYPPTHMTHQHIYLSPFTELTNNFTVSLECDCQSFCDLIPTSLT